jgi:hypothetical protein
MRQIHAVVSNRIKCFTKTVTIRDHAMMLNPPNPHIAERFNARKYNLVRPGQFNKGTHIRSHILEAEASPRECLRLTPQRHPKRQVSITSFIRRDRIELLHPFLVCKENVEMFDRIQRELWYRERMLKRQNRKLAPWSSTRSTYA